MWCKCVSKYGICDINTIVTIKDSFAIVEMSHTIFTYIFAPHLNKSGLSCRKDAGRYLHHSAVNDIIQRALAAAHVPSRLEPSGLYRSNGK